MKIIARKMKFLLMFLCVAAVRLSAVDTLSLRNNLMMANPGDYVVAAQNKTYTLLFIRSKTPEQLTIQEITVPANGINRSNFSWKDWIQNSAPGRTCWMEYCIAAATGEMRDARSLTSAGWRPVSIQEAFLPTLLNLKFQKIADRERKRVGDPLSEGGTGGKKIWQPPLVVAGQAIKGAAFDAWKAVWPRDNSPLSDKIIEIYTPQESSKYPSYFPYWLQVFGVVGKADLRIIDSGSGAALLP